MKRQFGANDHLSSSSKRSNQIKNPFNGATFKAEVTFFCKKIGNYLHKSLIPGHYELTDRRHTIAHIHMYICIWMDLHAIGYLHE